MIITSKWLSKEEMKSIIEQNNMSDSEKETFEKIMQILEAYQREFDAFEVACNIVTLQIELFLSVLSGLNESLVRQLVEIGYLSNSK